MYTSNAVPNPSAAACIAVENVADIECQPCIRICIHGRCYMTAPDLVKLSTGDHVLEEVLTKLIFSMCVQNTFQR